MCTFFEASLLFQICNTSKFEEGSFVVIEFKGVNVIRAADLEPAASARKTESGFREISP
jgi:hypothetical protein